jgi:hypothetical protein
VKYSGTDRRNKKDSSMTENTTATATPDVATPPIPAVTPAAAPAVKADEPKVEPAVKK